jgi:serine/threonine protein kinase
MLSKIRNIKSISSVQQSLKSNIYGLNELEYDETAVGEGGVGSVHKIFNIDGENKKGLLVKIVIGEEKASKSYETISLLHSKLNDHQRNSGVPIFFDYPELCGLPFLAFKGEIDGNDNPVSCFLLYDLTHLRFDDFGDENWDREAFIVDVPFEHKLFLAYQFARAVSFLHDIKFIHADLKAESLFLNLSKPQVGIIDFDGGYNYDRQNSALTLGAINAWASAQWRKLIGQGKSASEVSTEERLNEENWIIACAIFELLFGMPPYYFLEGNDEEQIAAYLKKNKWPNIDNETAGIKESNINIHTNLLQVIEHLREHNLSKLIDTFIQVFNQGFEKPGKRPTPAQWKSLLFGVCEATTTPEIKVFNADKEAIAFKNEGVLIEWQVEFATKVHVNGVLQDVFSNDTKIFLLDETELILKVESDFGAVIEKKTVRANKIDPIVHSFTSDVQQRIDLTPVELSWNISHCKVARLNKSDKDLIPIGKVAVSPEEKTRYILTAIGFFDQTVTADVEVDVITPEINEFWFEVNIEKGINNIDLFWTTSNAIEASIEPFVGNVATSGTTSVGINDKTEFTLTAKGSFSRVIKKIEAQPFPIPIIKGIFIPTPQFNLDVNVPHRLLEVPSILNKNFSVNFSNDIVFKPVIIPFEQFNEKLLAKSLSELKEPPEVGHSFFNNLFNKVLKHNNEKAN